MAKITDFNTKPIYRGYSLEDGVRAVVESFNNSTGLSQSSKPVKYAQPVPAAKDAKLAVFNHYHPVKSSKYDDEGGDFDRDACIEDINYYISLMDDYKLEQLEAFAHNLLRK